MRFPTYPITIHGGISMRLLASQLVHTERTLRKALATHLYKLSTLSLAAIAAYARVIANMGFHISSDGILIRRERWAGRF